MPEIATWQDLVKWDFPMEEGEEDDFDDSFMEITEDTAESGLPSSSYEASQANGNIGDDENDESASSDDNSSAITQKDRDNKVILLVSTTTGIYN